MTYDFNHLSFFNCSLVERTEDLNLLVYKWRSAVRKIVVLDSSRVGIDRLDFCCRLLLSSPLQTEEKEAK